MKSVVIPIADSLDQRFALRAGFSVARRAGADVVLVTACGADDRDEAQRTLDESRDRFADVAPSSTRVIDGPPVDVLLDLAESDDHLIAMSTHARRGVGRMVLGSVAEEVVRRSPQPILCVGPSARGVFLPGERIDGLVCTDDSAASAAVMRAAAQFATAVASTCTVIQVVGPDEDVALDGGATPRPIRDRAEAHCAEAARCIRERGVRAAHRVLPGDPAGAIVQAADTRSSGYIVVGTSGRTGLARVALGSVATDIVRNAPCPVLVVPTHEPTGTA